LTLLRQHEGIPVPNGGLLFRHQLANTGGKKARPNLWENHRGFTVGDGILAVALKILAFKDMTREFFGDLDIKTESHCTYWNGQA